jgi:hypothetical protein
MNRKRFLIKRRSIIFCQFSTNELFTLNLIRYNSYHAICFEFFNTSTNLEILILSINSFFKLIIYIWSHSIHFEFLYTSTNSEMDAINLFILYNTEATWPWFTLYEEKKGNGTMEGKHSDGWMVEEFFILIV